jgi:hypothetical protein
MKFLRGKKRLSTAARVMGERAMEKMPEWKTTSGRTTPKDSLISVEYCIFEPLNSHILAS